MTYEIIHLLSTLVGGISVHTTNASEQNPETAKIPAAWGQIRQRGYTGQLAAVYTNYESDSTGAYTEIIGQVLQSENDLPNGDTLAKVPTGDYAKFRVEGAMPQIVMDAWSAVWQAEQNGTLQRAYTADFELYPSEGVVELYIAVK